jgi:pilus assembly protein Flp/PilA
MNKLIAVVMHFLARFKEEDGQALVEYALILALVAIVVIGAVIFLGNGVHNTLNNVANSISNP